MQGRRRILVEILKSKGISSTLVLEAFLKVPRHFFVLPGLEFQAYEDKALSISDNQTISQPYTVAFQTELLQIKKGSKVLEIGTGSGYQAAILANMGVEVHSVERIFNLHQTATKLLQELNYKVFTYYIDGFDGLPQIAPFDGILITASIEKIPDVLKNQLSIGGCLVAPVGITGELQTMVKITRKSEAIFEEEHFGNFVFVPMLKGKQ